MNFDFAKDVNLTLSDDCACAHVRTISLLQPPPPQEKQYNTCYLTKKMKKEDTHVLHHISVYSFWL